MAGSDAPFIELRVTVRSSGQEHCCKPPLRCALRLYPAKPSCRPSSRGRQLVARSLAEARVGTALGLMHEQPAREWTLVEQALKGGLSRSAFAVRFRSTGGDTPIQYLTKWRLERAAAMLRDGAMVEQVAAAAGYESAAAFSNAFKRRLSVPPGAYRRADHWLRSPALAEACLNVQRWTKHDRGVSIFLRQELPA